METTQWKERRLSSFKSEMLIHNGRRLFSNQSIVLGEEIRENFSGKRFFDFSFPVPRGAPTTMHLRTSARHAATIRYFVVATLFERSNESLQQHTPNLPERS